MKRLICAVVLGLFITGCGAAARDSEFWKHPAMYKNWGHMKYSWNPENRGKEFTKQSQEEKWWGIPNNEGPGK